MLLQPAVLLSALENQNDSQIQVKLKICTKQKSALANCLSYQYLRVKMKFLIFYYLVASPVQENIFYEGM